MKGAPLRILQVVDQFAWHLVVLQHGEGFLRELIAGGVKRPTARQQRHCHPRRADGQQRLAAQSVNEPDRHEGHPQVDQADQHGLLEGGVGAPARLGENGGQIIEDGVDAGDLLKERNHQGDEHHEAHSPAQKRAYTNAGTSFSEALLDVAQLLLRRVRAARLGQDLSRPLGLSFPKQPARALGDGKEQEEIECRRDGIHPQHPAPVIGPNIQEKVVGEEGG